VGALPAPAAGDFFGVIVFLVIVVISILSKLQEGKKKKGDWEQPPETPSIEPEDLPEPIRRMLYGDRDRPVRTAKPARPSDVQQMDVPRTAAPRKPRPVQQPRTQPVTVAPPPVKPGPVQRPVVMRQQPRPAAPRIPEDDESRPRIQPPIQKPMQPEIIRATVPPPPKPVSPKAVKPVGPEKLVKAAFASDTAVKPVANPWMFKDKMDLRRAIVLAEILAPPLALRE